MTLNELKVGTWFRKWDGSVCKLIEKTSGRARIRLERPIKEVRRAIFKDKEGQAKEVKFIEKKAEFDVSLGCEVLEVIEKTKRANP
jgi:hypothetical protein